MTSRREQALALLAGKDASGRAFFDIAPRALTLGLGWRWAAIGTLTPDRRRIQLMSLCEHDRTLEAFAYPLRGTPCEALFQAELGAPTCFYARSIAELFPEDEALRHKGAESYRGELFFDELGRRLGHVFVMDDRPHEDDLESRAFFSLVAQRVGAEYRRLRTEEALRTSEERLNLVVTGAKDGLWDWDMVADTAWMSPVWQEIIGFSDAQMRTYRWREHVHPDDFPAARAAILAHFRAESTVFHNVHRHRRTDGSWIWVEARGVCVRDEDGTPIRFVGRITDISQQKRAEDALQSSEERYAAAARGSNDGLWDWDIPRDRIYFSPRLAEIIGIEPPTEDLRSHEVFRYIHPDDAPAYRDALVKHLKGDSAYFDCEFRVVPPGGEERWIHDRALAVRDASGRAVRMAGSVTDVTRQRRDREALQLAIDEARYANKVKTEFLANMSHELRTPLNSIIGFADAVLHIHATGEMSGDKVPEYAHYIRDSGLHLLELINDILDISRIEFGELPLNERALDVRVVAESCARLIELRARDAGQTLVDEIDADLPMLFADERRIKQVLINLLSNASKFTPTGGSLILSASVDDAGGIVFVVSDTGIGIAPDDQERVFSMFSQADSSLARRHDGVGLGLPLVKKLVELHDGEVGLRSTLGEGTTVTVRFPPHRTRHRAEALRAASEA